jgi:hypothetical protein
MVQGCDGGRVIWVGGEEWIDDGEALRQIQARKN